MPLVIPKAGPVRHVRTEEILSEILGHDNFDGESWAAGDRIIFENGTESRIARVPDDLFYDWPEPVPADLAEVKRTLGIEDADNWQQLFSHFENQSKKKGCTAAAVLLTAITAATASSVAALL